MSKIKEYTKDNLTVIWEASKCIHSSKCWKELPSVFDPKARPWVNMEGASTEAIAEQVSKCPSGALSYKIKDEEVPKETNDPLTVHLTKDGPLIIKQEVKIVNSDGIEEVKNSPVALCRCGSSANKPYCDGSHKSAGFKG